MRIVMGTGSRSMLTHPEARDIYGNLEWYLGELHKREVGGIHLITGMAEGWDEAVAKVGYRNSIPYDAYVPTKDYGKYYWGRKSLLGIDRLHVFEELLGGARKVIYLEDIYGQPRFMRRGEIDQYTIAGPNYQTSPGFWLHANMARNEEMVKISDMAVVYEAGSAGTRDAVARLRAAKKHFVPYPFTNRLFDPTSFV